MNNLSNYLKLTDSQRERYEALDAAYRLMYNEPEQAEPKFIVHVPNDNWPSWEEQLADPMVMLKAQLDVIQQHINLEDDLIPAVRVNFGTAQVAMAFGCEPAFPENNLPAAGSHVLTRPEAIDDLPQPSMESGWYPKVKEWTELWRENLPEFVRIQHPDIQSPFNSAHLIRGNDILMDFYDCPEWVEKLLTRVTDYMIELLPRLNQWCGNHDGWFADWGALWRGAGRISNCTSDLIGPDFYIDHVLKHDRRFLDAVGGGRMHCCGSSVKVIDTLLTRGGINGLDCDAGCHDPWHLAEIAPKQTVLILENYGYALPQLDRLLSRDWPKKRNIVVITRADSIHQGRQLLAQLRESAQS